MQGGKWFSLIDKVYRDQNLLMAFRKVAANGGAAGVGHVSSERFEERLIPNLRKLSEQLRDGTYRPRRAGLTLHPDETHIVDRAERCVDYLGYMFTREYRYPRKKSLQKFKETIRQQTKRTNGHRLPTIISRLNPTLRGWFAYSALPAVHRSDCGPVASHASAKHFA